MKLNGITCGGYVVKDEDHIQFSLETDWESAVALKGQELKLTEDDGSTFIASFAGYDVIRVEISGSSIRLLVARTLEPSTEESIRALEDNMGALTAKVEAFGSTVTDAASKADEAVATVSEASDKADAASTKADEANTAAVAAGTKADEASAKAEEANNTATEANNTASEASTVAGEAKATANEVSTKVAEAISKAESAQTAATEATSLASQANEAAVEANTVATQAEEAAEQTGTSPSVIAASAMYVNAISTLTNTELTDVRELIKDWEVGVNYTKGQIRRYDGKYYRMAQDIKPSQEIYKPGQGTESLYTLIDLAPDGIRIWHQPTHAENSFAYHEKCHYPDAEGAIYVSQREGNTSVPGTDEWWKLDEVSSEK